MHPMKTKVYSFRAPVGHFPDGVNCREAIKDQLVWAVIKGILIGGFVYWSGQKIYKRIQNMEVVDKS